MGKDIITVTVLYPRDETSTFDMKYYLATHMPLAEKAWVPHGLLSWSVTEIPAVPGADGKLPAYSVQTFTTWEAKGESGMDGVGAGMASEDGQALAADVPNFSNRMPSVLAGKLAKSVTL